MNVKTMSLAWVLLCSGSAWAEPTQDLAESARPDDEQPRTDRFQLDLGVDGLISGAGAGMATALGLRFLPLPRLAVTLDCAFGLEGVGPATEDRWWTIPGIAWVLALGPATLDLGGGLGIGTVSPFASTHAFFAAPFAPTSHVTAPTARTYVALSLPVATRLALFARAEVGTLLGAPASADPAWEGLTLGLRLGIF